MLPANRRPLPGAGADDGDGDDGDGGPVDDERVMADVQLARTRGVSFFYLIQCCTLKC
jgi:hypothetical protein